MHRVEPGKGFASLWRINGRGGLMEGYSPREIALAAGVPEDSVLAALGVRGRGTGIYVGHQEAVLLGRQLAQQLTNESGGHVPRPAPIFALVAQHDSGRHPLASAAASSGIHAGLAAMLVFLAGQNLMPRVAAQRTEAPADLIHLIFLAQPGPGGGGGGGGHLQPAPAPRALREGIQPVRSPIPERVEPPPIERVPRPREPEPVPALNAERLPVLMAPLVKSPSDPRDRIGLLEQSSAEADSHGSGREGGAGTGTGSGLGAGDGGGVGPGSGGGTGGGPYRPGSGIQPPRLLREVKADYTEEARQRRIAGEVVLEIVVRRDGGVGDVRLVRGLGGGLNERAMEAVRQWRFAPAERQGSPVDVIVEVGVEFTLR
jgi:TonB family protein